MWVKRFEHTCARNELGLIQTTWGRGNCGPNDGPQTAGVLAFPGVSRVFPADAALGLSARIIGEINTAVNRIFGQGFVAKPYILTNIDPETIHFLWSIFTKTGSSGRRRDARRNPKRIKASTIWLAIAACSAKPTQFGLKLIQPEICSALLMSFIVYWRLAECAGLLEFLIEA
jgi:hypothetical protein